MSGQPVQTNAETIDQGVEQRRSALRDAFLSDALPGVELTVTPLVADASFRRYYRIEGADQGYMLMQDPPDRPPVPPLVMVEPFTAIAKHLRAIGLNAPRIHHQDFENGLLLLDDLGDMTFTRAFEAGMDRKALYERAIDVLIALHRSEKRNAIDIPEYDLPVYQREADLLVEWYIPTVLGRTVTDEEKSAYHQAWVDIVAKMPNDQATLVLRDYHIDNLMHVEGEAGLDQCGIIDFQDALIGQMAYDVMSLLQDARCEVEAELVDHLLARYFTAMGDIDRDAFMTAYHALAAQRHAKVLGIFVRLYQRDGKARYLDFLPHVHGLFIQSLNQPVCAPLKKWCEDCGFKIETIPNASQILGGN